MEQPTKRCNDCQEPKLPSEFHKCKANKDGLQNKCKACHERYDLRRKHIINERNRRRREANIEKLEGLVRVGEIIREDYMKPMGLSGAALARRIGMSANAVNSMLQGATRLTPIMATKICEVVGGSPEVLLRIDEQEKILKEYDAIVRDCG